MVSTGCRRGRQFGELQIAVFYGFRLEMKINERGGREEIRLLLKVDYQNGNY